MMYDVLILGSGPAGLTAAIYTSRSNLKTLVIAGMPAGGQLMLTTDVENWPGFEDGIQGPELVLKCRKQAERFGAVMVDENVLTLSGNVKDGFTVLTDANNTYQGKLVIIATGASAKWLGLESETHLKGRGVSACATCDGFFFKGKEIAVVGGGDSALEEATFLTKFASKVYVLYRGEESQMRASAYMKDKAKANQKVELVCCTEVLEILGDTAVTGIRVVNLITKEEKVMGNIKGLFIAIGHEPNTKFLQGFLEIGKNGYLDAKDYTHTNVEGVFVAGDVCDYRYRQAVSAAGAGCMAGLDAAKYFEHNLPHGTN